MGKIKARRRGVWREFLVCTKKNYRTFWPCFKRDWGWLATILLIAWLCLILIPPTTFAQGVLDLWCRAFGFERRCWCWGADCVANAETVRVLALVGVGIWLVLAVRRFLFRPEKPRRAIEGCFKRNWKCLIIAVLFLVGSLLWCYWGDIWCWLQSGGTATNAETLRNLGLGAGAGLAAIIGVPLALWRSWAAERQTRTSNEQAETAERDLVNERYQKGAEMLGNAALATRIGGIYALERLAEEHPAEYHIEIVKLLCAFIRYPTKREDPALSDEGKRNIWFQAVVTAAQAVGRRSEEQIRIERSKSVKLNLSGAYLSPAGLRGANLSGVGLDRADLSGAELCDADLAHADLRGADLVYANLRDTDLTEANLLNANISGATLDGVKNLTQTQLDTAYISKGRKPPSLDDAVDPETGKPLVWQGRVLPLPAPESSGT